MKNKKMRISTTSRMALAATLMAAPIVTQAEPPKADAPASHTSTAARSSADAYLKQNYPAAFRKMACPCVIAGQEGRHTVYKNAANQHFWIDPATGDQKFVAASRAIKSDSPERSKQ